MGRPYAKVFRDIWSDEDFLALPPGGRYMYLFLLSQPNLSAAGVLPITIRRWADIAGVSDPSEIEAALALLQERGYVITDPITEELLVRTFVRNDELWRIPNTLYSVLRDAEQIASPQIRLALAREFSLLAVDELNGKRSEAMKAQLSRVTATLSSTVKPTVRPTMGQGLSQLFGQPLSQPKRQPWGEGEGEGVGAGRVSGFNANVNNQSSLRYAREKPDLIEEIISEIQKATGKTVSPEWASKVADHILAGRETSDPLAYVRTAIRNEPNPQVRFLEQY